MEIRFAVDPAVLPMAMAAVEAELRRFLAEPPGPEERSAALLSLRREASLRQLRLERAVDQLTVAQAWGQGPEAERLLLASAEALDPAALQALAAAWIQPEALIWVISGDRARIEPLLEAAGRTPDAIRGGPAIMDGEPPLPL